MEIDGLEFEYRRRPSNLEVKRITTLRKWLFEHTVELHTLPERNRNILEERFGLFDDTIRAYSSLAEKYELDEMSFHALIQDAISDMQRAGAERLRL